MKKLGLFLLFSLTLILVDCKEKKVSNDNHHDPKKIGMEHIHYFKIYEGHLVEKDKRKWGKSNSEIGDCSFNNENFKYYFSDFPSTRDNSKKDIVYYYKFGNDIFLFQ
jgi:hypothetical protein